MKRTLYLLRHAKSSWDEPSLDDFDRPLNPRGRKAAADMAKAMRRRGLVPDLVLCSAARRTQDTWALMAPILAKDVPVRVLKGLYLATPSGFLTALARVPETVERALLLGHNPGIEQLAVKLAGAESKSSALATLQTKYPTCALAEILFDIPDWSAARSASGRLIRFLRPRDL